MPKSLTIILPVYNEEQVISKTINALCEALGPESIDYSILIIDDGSSDGTWDEIKGRSEADVRVKCLRFSRNFGKDCAIFAGLEYADTDCVIVMDADMQHPPETALKMYKMWAENDFLIIEAVKSKRQRESAFSRGGANMFYKMLAKTSGINLKNASDFKLLDRSAVQELRKMPERFTFFRAMTGWTGLKTGIVYFEVAPRIGGKTKWSAFSLMKLAVKSIVSYTSAPMHLVTAFGSCFCVFAVIVAAHTLYMNITGRSVEGFTTVIILLLLIGGILMLSLGIIGVYISKIYEEVKLRPRYIISEKAVGQPEDGENG
jgi:dolichol-phosphate mannosyltransferase